MHRAVQLQLPKQVCLAVVRALGAVSDRGTSDPGVWVQAAPACCTCMLKYTCNRCNTVLSMRLSDKWWTPIMRAVAP